MPFAAPGARVACFGDPVTKLRQVKQATLGTLHRLISATRGGSAPSSWSRVDRRRTGGASNHDIVALRELTAPVCPVQALGFSGRSADESFFPLLPLLP